MPLFDLRLLNASLPVPRPPPHAPPVMVLGAQNDTVVVCEKGCNVGVTPEKLNAHGIEPGAQSHLTLPVVVSGAQSDTAVARVVRDW